MSATLDLVRDAIGEMRVMQCTYNGAHRVVHPLLVLEKDDGSYVLHCWQVDGESTSNRSPPCWGHFAMATMEDVEVLPQTFNGAPDDYNPDRYRNSVCRVPKPR